MLPKFYNLCDLTNISFREQRLVVRLGLLLEEETSDPGERCNFEGSNLTEALGQNAYLCRGTQNHGEEGILGKNTHKLAIW